MTIIATYYDKSDKEFEIQKNDNCNGTHLQGYINVSYSSYIVTGKQIGRAHV